MVKGIHAENVANMNLCPISAQNNVLLWIHSYFKSATKVIFVYKMIKRSYNM